MKKLLSALMAAFVMAVMVTGTSYARKGADAVSDRQTDIATWMHKGSSSPALSLSTTGQMTMPDGITTKHELFASLPAISTRGVLGVTVTTTTLKAQGTTYTTAFITQPSYPQGLTFRVELATRVQASNIITTVTVTGVTARGETITEVINGVNDSSWKKSNNAFASVSSFTFSALNSIVASNEVATVYLSVGSTGTYGLAGNLSGSDDSYKIRAWQVNASSITIDTDYDTASFPASAAINGTNLEVWYRDTTSAPVKPR